MRVSVLWRYIFYKTGPHLTRKSDVCENWKWVSVFIPLFQTILVWRSNSACMCRQNQLNVVGETWNLQSTVDTWFHRFQIYFSRKSGNPDHVWPENMNSGEFEISFSSYPPLLDYPGPRVWFCLYVPLEPVERGGWNLKSAEYGRYVIAPIGDIFFKKIRKSGPENLRYGELGN